MLKTESSTIKLTSWPTPQDYNEAVQNLLSNTKDGQLQAGTIAVDALGLPRPVSGSFASVYKVACTESNFALRCFLRNISDQEARYAAISDFIQRDDLPYTVTFDFMKEGVKVNGLWFPALKMEWVEGQPLDAYITAHLDNPAALAELAEKFKTMCLDLHKEGIAHGDLQHGNILVIPDGNLRLVDYDGVYVPAMHSMQSNEIGHRNYQHPARAAHHFGLYLDNFSAWVIYASLRAIAYDTRLYALLQGGDDCLLFRKRDFDSPQNSRTFILLEKSPSTEVRKLARFIRSLLRVEPESVPPLSDSVPEVAELEPLPAQPALSQYGAQPSGNQRPPTAHMNVNNSQATTNSTSQSSQNHDPWWRGAVAGTNQTAQSSTTSQFPPHPTATPPTVIGQQLQLSVPEVELTGPPPRLPRWNAKPTVMSPVAYQWMMLMNPCVWAMIFTWPHAGASVYALGAAIWTTAVNIILEILIWRRPFQARQLVKYGTAVVGRIEHKIMDVPASASSNNSEPVFRLEYSFPINQMRFAPSPVPVSKAEFDQVQEGEQVTILYRKRGIVQTGIESLIYRFSPYKADRTAALGNPAPVPEYELNRRTPREIEWNEAECLVNPWVWQLAMMVNPFVWIFIGYVIKAAEQPSCGVVAVVVSIICALFEMAIWGRSLRERQFVKFGTAVIGKIDRLTEETFTGSGRYHDTTYLMKYSFHTATGNLVVHEMHLPPEKAQLLKEGQDITILYREDGSAVTSIVYKFCCYKAVL